MALRDGGGVAGLKRKMRVFAEAAKTSHCGTLQSDIKTKAVSGPNFPNTVASIPDCARHNARAGIKRDGFSTLREGDMRVIIFLFVFIVLAGVLLAGKPVMAQDYILGAGDLLKITVYENDDLTTTTRISGDGMISVPLIGKMKVAGMTPGEA